MKSLNSIAHYKYLYHLANFDSIWQGISDVDWSVIDVMDTESATSYFYSILNTLVNDFVPKRKVCSTSRYPPWYNRPLIKIIKNKLNAHARWKKYNNVIDYAEFKLLRKREKKLSKDCYTKYIALSEKKITSSPKYFWSFIKSKFSANEIPSNMYFNDKSSPEGFICDLFNNYFSSVFVSGCNQSRLPSPQPSSPSVDISSINITDNLVNKHLKNLCVNKGAGFDNIHPLLVSKLYAELAAPLAKLFRKSLSEGIVPSVWKQAIITPVHKGGDKHNIKLYRPISKLCVFANINNNNSAYIRPTAGHRPPLMRERA
ncbi:uncharacterized protein LOC133516089 [Cydia pomonella]|uniref:uncharacterized protein LOC133516089 n=1 Tax=Cydia pomonella TaxID=82600 RepID=UPI002ADD6193|nr:uncharacterized protein LOC133516089 [Cydia pomonella]